MPIEPESEKFVIFRIADYCLGLSIDNVLRVIEYLPQQAEKLNEIGLTQIGRHIIQILNLYQSLGCEQPHQTSESRIFLVITHSPQGHLYGIPVYIPPDVIEIPLRLMQLLPPYDHPANILEIASHAAVIPDNEVTTTVFLLDLNRVKALVT